MRILLFDFRIRQIACQQRGVLISFHTTGPSGTRSARFSLTVQRGHRLRACLTVPETAPRTHVYKTEPPNDRSTNLARDIRAHPAFASEVCPHLKHVLGCVLIRPHRPLCPPKVSERLTLRREHASRQRPLITSYLPPFLSTASPP